jgi:hypothetical protein
MTLWEEMNKQIQSDLVEPLQLYMSKFPEAKVIQINLVMIYHYLVLETGRKERKEDC